MIVQVQPEFKDAAVWQQIAEQERVSFEAIEPSMPAVMNTGDREKILDWYRSLSNVTSLHGSFMDNNPASGDPDIAQLSIRKLEESCRLAKELHIPRVVFHSGAFPYLRGRYLEQWSEKCAAVYDRLAAEYDLQILIENSADVDARPIAELLARTENPRIGACLDIGHANYSREPLEKWFEDLADHIEYIHISDNMGRFDDHIVLGTGTVDWQTANRLVRGLNREIPLTLETGNPGKTMASIRFLREAGYFGF